MLTNLYVLIIIIPIVQITLCKNINKPLKIRQEDETLNLLNLVKKVGLDKNVRALLQNDAKDFESVIETVTSTTKKTTSAFVEKKRTPAKEKNYHELKQLLGKLLEQIEDLEKDKRENNKQTKKSSNHKGSVPPTPAAVNPSNKLKKKKKDDSSKQRWGHWTDWSSCSVSCGKGRQIRWRHCIEHCEESETEMEEKTCQLPSCGPGKLFGVFKLR